VSFIHLVYSSLPFSTVHTLHRYTTFYRKKIVVNISQKSLMSSFWWYNSILLRMVN